MEIRAWQRVRITVVMAIAYTAEHAEAMLLGAMYLAIGRSLDIGASKLGTLSMWRALVQAVAIPFVGVAGNLYNRIYLIATGTVLWGCMGLGMGFSTNYSEAAAWCALNGVGLALVMPCVQSIIAEVYRAKSRGKAFGVIFTASALGGMAGNFLAITYAYKEIGMYEGWRVIFFTTAGVAAGATLVVLFGGIEPRSLRPKEKVDESAPKKSFLRAAWAGICVIVKSTWSVFRVRSFQIILVAGIVGAVAHVNNGYKVMYFQLLGFSDLATATLSTCTTLGLAVGFFIGGAVGDALAVKFPNASRPFVNQLSMALAGPLAAVLYKAMPGSSAHATGVQGSNDKYLPIYGVLLFAIGTLASWPASNNAAIFADVVPESVRTSVYAFDKCIIGALGAVTTPLAGLLAERAFGFQHVSHKKPAKGHAAVHAHPPAAAIAAQHANNLNNARALENGLLCIMLIPMALKFFIYFGLYWTLPRDRIEEIDDKGMEASAQEGNAKGDEPGSPREPQGPMIAAHPGNTPSPCGKVGQAGSRGQSLRQTSSFGSTKYTSLPSTGVVSREALRASLAKQVVQSAGVDPPGPETLDDASDRRILERQALGGPSGGGGGSLGPSGGGPSWRATSMETARKFLALEMSPSLPPAGSPQPSPEKKGDV
ncbi:g3339 [Coccomyxa elongata]